jgi:soluble lytic murein transglycosylase-like protein
MAFFTALALGLAAAGVGLQAYGQKKQGQAAEQLGAAQQKAANAQADLADVNASVADLQASDALERGQIAEDRFRTQVKGVIASQRTGEAAGNIDVGFGSAVDVQKDAAFLGELDALTIRTNAAREAWGYQVQGADLRKSAQIARDTGFYEAEAGKQANANSTIAAVGTIATGGGNLLLNKYGFGPSGKAS